LLIEIQKNERKAQCFRCNSVSCIITPPLFGKLQELRLLVDLKATCAGTSFTQPLPQGLGLLFPFIPNQTLARQGKSFGRLPSQNNLGLDSKFEYYEYLD